MKRNKSGFIKESFETYVDTQRDSFYCNYTVIAFKQLPDYQCMDSDWDHRGYIEIIEVKINSIVFYNEGLNKHQEITLDALSVEVANEIIQKVHDDAVVKINEGIGG